MNIAIFNWKDIKHPFAGGAEVLTHEMAKRFVKEGHNVLFFASDFEGAKKEESIDGVTIVRAGSLDIRAFHNSVHYKAYKYYQKNLKGKIDVVIDEVHGIPFFANFYVKEKVVALICEVADDIWFRMFSFPWSSIGWFMERIYLFLYRRTQILAISPSTKTALVHTGISPKHITVLPMGITRVPVSNIKKEVNPTLIFVGRLNKMKGIEDAILAVAKSKEKISKLHLWIVGKGEEKFTQHIKKLSQQEGISVTFWNYVSQKKKFELMARAHGIIVPSLREGFGLIVPEAGSVGTPAIVYDVYGLRDTIRDGVNGIKVKKSVATLSEGIERLFSDNKKYKKMCIEAKKQSLQYNWEDTVTVALKSFTK